MHEVINKVHINQTKKKKKEKEKSVRRKENDPF